MLPILLIGSDKNAIRLFIKNIALQSAIEPSHLYRYMPETSIHIDDIREISQYVMKRDLRKKHLIILHKFHTAKQESQNAFLKTLEENGDSVQFVLIADEETSLLPTIRSRTHIQYLHVDESQSDILDTYGFRHKPMTYPLWLSCSAQVPKDKLLAVLDAVLIYVRELYLNPSFSKWQNQLGIVMHKILQIRSHARHIAINPEYALDACGYELTQVFAQ